MKIAFVTLGYRPLRTSGLDLSGERLVAALLDAGHEITVIAGMREKIREVHVHPNLEIHRIQLDKSDWIGFAYRAARHLSVMDQFEVIHFWDIHFGWAFRGKFIGSLQHSFRQRLRSLDLVSKRGFSWISRMLYYRLAYQMAELPTLKRAGGLIAGSATTRDEFVRYYGVSPDCVSIAPHGVDTQFFCPSNRIDSLRKQHKLKDGERTILFAGFITRRKGLEILARALPLIEPIPRLIILGQWRSERYRREVYDLLRPWQQHVIEIGFAPDEAMPDYYSLADVYVSTSFLEGFGLPLAESLSCETPVVALEAGSVAEVVGEGGILISENNPSIIAAAITDLLQNEEGRKAMGKRGRKHIENEFSLQSMLSKTLEAYMRFK